MLHIRAKATTDQELGKEYNCHVVAVLEGKTVVHLTAGVILGQFLIGLARPQREGSCHAVTIELSPQQKLDMTNQILALCRSHPLSWSTITSQCA